MLDSGCRVGFTCSLLAPVVGGRKLFNYVLVIGPSKRDGTSDRNLRGLCIAYCRPGDCSTN